MKKVLFIANYYYPDVASLGQLMTEICEALKERYDITVIAAVPNYSEDINLDKSLLDKKYYQEEIAGIKVFRVIVPNVNKRSKLSRVNYIKKYYCNAKAAIKHIKDYDVIFTVSQPPILGGLLGRYAKKLNPKAKLIYNIQDFNPEQIEAIGYSKVKPIISSLRKMDNLTLRDSDCILVVGNDQVETVKKRGEEFLSKVTVINNWIDESQIFPLSMEDEEVVAFKHKYNLANKFIVMYSGNLGLFYDLENLIKAAHHFKHNKDLIFVFAGEGAVKKDLEQYKEVNELSNILFLPYQPKDKLNISLNIADVHLVVNAKGIKGVSVPSKLYGVLAVGKPIIGVLESNSEARNIITKSNSGKCVNPEDYSGFYKLLEEFYNNRETIKIMGCKGRAYLEENLTKRISMEKYDKLFKEL